MTTQTHTGCAVTSSRPRFAKLNLLIVAVLALTGVSAHAQTTPDAGRLLQEQTLPPQLPKPVQGISIQSPATVATPSGGAQVVLQSISFMGNTRYTQAQLQVLLADAVGKSFDLAGLRALAERVSDHYRAAGYPFASAYIAPQSMQGGALQIAIIEGQYGQVKAQSDDARLASAAQFFLAPLKSGSVIESAPLERLSLLLEDQPGLKVSPIIRPGQEVGTGDLIINVERTQRVTGDAGLDNQGNRYTGRDRAHFNLDLNSPFTMGDQIILRSLLTDQSMWMGTLGYNLPVSSTGLRGSVSYSHAYYELGGSFAINQSTGTADVVSMGLSYPLIRSQRASLTLAGAWQDKKLNDKNGLANTSADKTSTTLPLSLNFDLRDGVGGWGITYGAVSWTLGEIKLLDANALASDSQAKTNGNFNKINLDIAHLQSINASFTAFARLSTQGASKNLDSSEDFSLGGANGVRAYPTGEAFGDAGWLTQLELRYSAGPYAPYAFYDVGSVTTNANPWEGSGANERKLAGAGFGLRYQRGHWSADAALAWRLEGGKPQADTVDTRENGPQAWMSLAYKF